jgi:hypothetical protein
MGGTRSGKVVGMESHEEDGPDPDDIRSRAELLPEEHSAGSDDPQMQARAVLEESQRRVEAPHDPPDGERDARDPHAEEHEHRESQDTV